MPASKKLDINLLKEGGLSSRPLGRFLKWSLSYGRYIIIGTQIIVLLAFFSRFILDQQLSDLHTRINEKTNILEALRPIEINTRNLQNKIAILKSLEDARSLYSITTTNLAENVPSSVIVEQVIINDNTLLLRGIAQNNSVFSQLLSFLKQDPLYSQISIENVSYEDDGSIEFQISTILTTDTKKVAENVNN